MKGRRVVSGKGAIAVGAVVGLIIGLLVGYWTYTQAITRFVSARAVAPLYEENTPLLVVNLTESFRFGRVDLDGCG